MEAQSGVTNLREQLMEEIAPVDPLFNGDWIAEVNIVDDESSSEVNEYLLSWVNDHSSDAISNTVSVKECLGKSEKYIRERNNYQTWQLSLISYPSQAINTWFTQMFMTERKQ